eukprot:scaffold34678_cov71-Phaeocystis_antarctica.AAC.3
MQAYITSDVVMDIAAFKVSHSAGCDKDATASLIIIHIGVGQRCRARDVESPAILPTMSTRVTPRGDG